MIQILDDIEFINDRIIFVRTPLGFFNHLDGSFGTALFVFGQKDFPVSTGPQGRFNGIMFGYFFVGPVLDELTGIEFDRGGCLQGGWKTGG